MSWSQDIKQLQRSDSISQLVSPVVHSINQSIISVCLSIDRSIYLSLSKTRFILRTLVPTCHDNPNPFDECVRNGISLFLFYLLILFLRQIDHRNYNLDLDLDSSGVHMDAFGHTSTPSCLSRAAASTRLRLFPCESQSL